MHDFSPTIKIIQVSNGWMVILPNVPKIDPYNKMLREGVKMFKAVKEDNILDEIAARVEEEEEKNFGLKDLRDDRTHIFKTFKEVLAFLKITIDE